MGEQQRPRKELRLLVAKRNRNLRGDETSLSRLQRRLHGTRQSTYFERACRIGTVVEQPRRTTQPNLLGDLDLCPRDRDLGPRYWLQRFRVHYMSDHRGGALSARSARGTGAANDRWSGGDRQHDEAGAVRTHVKGRR